MTLSINFISGNKKSVCRNDAFSIIEKNEDAGKPPNILEIIPASELDNNAKNAFIAAVHAVTPEEKEKLVTAAIETVKTKYPSLLPT